MSNFAEEQEPKFDFPIPDDWPPSLALAFAELMEKALAEGFPLVVPVRKDATPEQITRSSTTCGRWSGTLVWRTTHRLTDPGALSPGRHPGRSARLSGDVRSIVDKAGLAVLRPHPPMSGTHDG